ncbi:MAG: hypothetical protein AAFR04_08215 [Pseudomonadota bacterium]
MPIASAYVFFVSMDVDPDHEDLFNEVYDDEHVPYLLEVPGVRAVTRVKGEPFAVSMAGEVKSMPTPSPVYTALYEIDGPEVLTSEGWAKAVERGRWAPEVRPHTTNRAHGLYKVHRSFERG